MLQRQRPTDGLEEFAGTLATGFVELMKPRIVEAIQDKILAAVETGRFESGRESNLTQNFDGLGSALFNSDDQRSFNLISVEVEGKIAIATIESLKSGGEPVRLRLKMRDKKTHWQIIGIENFAELAR